MMKDIKNEYVNLIQEDLPDLWDRIEASIDEIEASKISDNETSEVNIANEVNTINRVNVKNEVDVKNDINAINIGNKKALKKIRGYKKFVAPVVMAALLLLSVGIYQIMNGGRKASESTMMAATSYEAEAAMDYAPAYEAEETIDYSESVSDSFADYEASESAEFGEEKALNEASTEKDLNSATSESNAAMKATAMEDASLAELEAVGRLTLCEDNRFVKLETDDGIVTIIYIPESYRKEILALDGMEKIKVKYVKIENFDDIGGEVSEEYKNVEYEIVSWTK